MEHYIQDNIITTDNIFKIEDFVKEFLTVLSINKTAFARYIEIDISNLNKNYSSETCFNTKLALKFGHFFHTPANIWLQIEAKNEILIFQKEEKTNDKSLSTTTKSCCRLLNMLGIIRGAYYPVFSQLNNISCSFNEMPNQS